MTKKTRQQLVAKGSFPYTIEAAAPAGWLEHSYIQTLTDERTFVNYANSNLEYRIKPNSASAGPAPGAAMRDRK